MATSNRQFLVRTGLSLPAGTLTQAPLTFQPGPSVTTAATGSMEWDGYNLFITENSTQGTTSSNLSAVIRRTVAYTDATMTPLINTYSAIGTTQSGATQLTTDYAYVNSSSATAAPYNGISLPAAIPGRSVKIVNNSSNTIYVYPQVIVASLSTVSSSGTLLTISGGSTTSGLYPGMTISYSSGTSGAFASNTVITSIVSSTTFTVNFTPTTALVGATVAIGTTSGINSLASNAAYTIIASTSVEFVAVTTSLWISASAAQIAASNGSGGSGVFTPGALIYSTDTFGSLQGLSDISTAGVPLVSGGTNLPPSYTAINLASSVATGPSTTAPAYGILPIANGGTGTNGSGLNSSGATYSLVNSTATTINFGGSGTTISIGNASGTTTINNNLAVSGTSVLTGNTTITGNLTVSGTQFISNATNTAIADNVIELAKPVTGWLLSDNGYDIGIKYNYYKTAALYVVTNSVGNGTTTTLTLSDTELILPVGTVITVGTTLSPINGKYAVTASAAGSVSFLSTYNTSMTTIGTISIVPVIAMTTATSVGTTATINYSSATTLIAASATVSLTGFSISGYNGTYTVVTAGNGTFTVTTTGSNLGTPTAATGNIVINDLHAFAGVSNDELSFEYYSEGLENTGLFGGRYGTIKAGQFMVAPPSSVTSASITAGAAISIPASVFFDTSTSASSTATQANTINIGQATIGALNTAVTYTNASSLYISNAPTNGSNVTITNAYALQVVAGNSLLGGNLAVNGGTLSSTASTFALLNTTVGTINSFGATTAINMGGSSTNAYAFTGSSSGATFTLGGAAATGNSLSINGTSGGTVSLSTPVTTGTANLFNSVTGAINMGGTSTTVNIGSTANSTLIIAGTNGASGTATMGTTTGVVTANVFNTIATTGNLFGAATTVNIAANVTSTLTFGNAASAGNTNRITIAANGGTASFDASSTAGTATLFPTVTGPVYIGSGTTSVTIGAAAATVTIGNGGNSTLTVSGGSGSVATINTNSGVSTANVFNTVVTTGNIFGLATTLSIANAATGAITGSIGTSSTTGSTYTFGGAIASGTNAIKIGAASGGTASFDAVNAAATGGLFQTVTGTINIGGQGASVNFGTTGANTVVTINGSTATSIQGGGASTANVFNSSNTTLGNLFGYATTVAVAGSVAATAASTLTYGGAVSAGVINTVRINANGGTAAFDAVSTAATATIFNSITSTVNYSTSATAVNIGSTTGITTIKTPSVVIGVNTANNTLTVNGNTSAGTATISSNVTTGTVSLFSTTTGTINIGSSSIAAGYGIVKLGVSPSQLATGNEVVTANWVLNNINSSSSTSINLGTNITSQIVDSVTNVSAGSFVVGAAYTVSALGTTTNAQWNTIGGTTGVTYIAGSTFVASDTGTGLGTGTAYTGQAFDWGHDRSVKYVIQATQVGSTSTRSQSSELMVTHDAPFLIFTGATATASTALTVASNSGLYVGMTIAIYTNAGSDVINTSTTGITTITAIAGTAVTLAAAATITVGTTLKAYLATSFSASITASNSTTSVLYSGMSAIVGAAYPGMYITGTGVTAGTYVTTINNTTGNITFNQALATSAGAVISGTPNVYVTEYAALETNGTVCLFTAQTTTTAPYYIQLTTTPLVGNTVISGVTLTSGALLETVIKLEKSYVELY